MSNDTNGAPRKLMAKLAKVMGAVGRVPKRGRNKFHGYEYVMESDLTEAVRNALVEQGVMLIPSVDSIDVVGERTTKAGATETQVRAWITYTFIDAESGETWSVRMPGDGVDQSDKAVYKAITGSGKYLLLKTFLIPTGDDPEHDTAPTDARSGRKPEPAPARTTVRNPQPTPDASTATFTLNGKTHTTAGIGRDDLLRVWTLSAALEKASGKGTAKEVMMQTANVDTSLKLTAETGKAVLAALREACGAAGVDPDAEVAA